MRVGAFEITGSLPALGNTQVFASLTPWINAGQVGEATLQLLEKRFQASEIGRLARPGQFYDFTRYRPMASYAGDERVVNVPNTFVNYAHDTPVGDCLFLHCLEPHAMGELYTDSILRLLDSLNVSRYVLVGSMYDFVPHMPMRFAT